MPSGERSSAVMRVARRRRDRTDLEAGIQVLRSGLADIIARRVSIRGTPMLARSRGVAIYPILTLDAAKWQPILMSLCISSKSRPRSARARRIICVLRNGTMHVLSCRKVCDRGGDAGGLALAAGRCCSSLRLDLAEESAVDADVFDGSRHRPNAQLILLE